MKYLRLFPAVVAVVVLGVACLGAPVKPPAKPAEIEVSVSPEAVEPGSTAHITLRLSPIENVAINRYPKIRFSVPASDGLVAAGETSVGSDAPPPPDKLKTNYFDEVDPLEMNLVVDSAAVSGRHDVEGRLVYTYCVKKNKESVFCAQKRVTVTVPLNVR